MLLVVAEVSANSRDNIGFCGKMCGVRRCPLEDLLDRLDSWVGVGSVLLSCGLLVPVEDLVSALVVSVWLWWCPEEIRCGGTYSSNERRNQGNIGLSAGDGLAETEEESKVAAEVLAMVSWESVPSREVRRVNGKIGEVAISGCDAGYHPLTFGQQ